MLPTLDTPFDQMILSTPMHAMAVSNLTLAQEAQLFNTPTSTPPEDRYALGITPYGTPTDGFRPNTDQAAPTMQSSGPNPSTQLDCINTEC